ncbi:DUF4265 domain-containing protein [Fodinicola feengrottensis]|uniref:DUF4265 domain-containing protein n=1 Tax=Fodinicola feengrottensis TaxID=435914 RepID=A0ABN2HT85_9ACTN|nr:DUF4265 domain-containing protein [Fodinicola feengrottensis]
MEIVEHRAGEEVIGHVQIVVRLDQDDEGWPPVDSERLWAVSLEPGIVRVDNIPWFAQNLATEDLVRVLRDHDGVLCMVEKLHWSGNCTIRVILLGIGKSAAQIRAILDQFAELGINGEGFSQYSVVALNIPSGSDFSMIKGVLDHGEVEGRWTYEEACVGGAWPS